MGRRLVTVVETPAYLAAAKGLLTDGEREAVVDMVAADLLSGISLGGGVRKVRIGLPGTGKSGGARVVFFFGGDEIPLFLLTVFAKSERATLSPREQAALVESAKAMAKRYRRNR